MSVAQSTITLKTNLFKMLDKFINEHGGYSEKTDKLKILFKSKQASFKEAIYSFEQIFERMGDPFAPLRRSEHMSAERFRKGLNNIFYDNSTLRKPEIAKQIVKICKNFIKKMPTGLGKRILWDATNDAVIESGIIHTPTSLTGFIKQEIDAIKFTPPKPIYRYVDLGFDTPGSGLHDKQIIKILAPFKHIAKFNDLAIILGKEYAEEFRNKVKELDLGLSGNNTLRDDILIGENLNILSEWVSLIQKDLKIENKILQKIKGAILEGKRFKTTLFSKYQSHKEHFQDTVKKIFNFRPHKFYKNIADFKKQQNLKNKDEMLLNADQDINVEENLGLNGAI